MTVHKPLAETGTVSSFVADGVADVSFGHPKSNSLPASVLSALADEITALGSRADVRAILLRSYGTGAFCAGASFDELAAIRDAAQGKEFFMGFARVILAMTRCPKPIVDARPRQGRRRRSRHRRRVGLRDRDRQGGAAIERARRGDRTVRRRAGDRAQDRDRARSRRSRSTPSGATRGGANATDCMPASSTASSRWTRR